MYIREDADKLHRRRVIASAFAAVLLIVMLVCLYRIDTVCMTQEDTLDQVMELRRGGDELADAVDIIPVATVLLDETSPDPAVDLTAEDYELICRVVAAEARGESYGGQLAVAQCIRDRARLWGLTPAEVVTAPGQFAEPYQGEIGPETMAAVNDCLIDGASALDRPVTHFAEVSISPYWAANKEVAGVIGNHKFYK
ncbi:cell wall hydrolase [Bacilliculturomica massiliensis]|uniref:cell wall hydrolase n=1 Tax=Bacilliculturomica massiliensis TaxID=1917867 RepID=UPI001031CDEE|nr:cell wall hydrolase [Bacilliculturomica massiliensis]